MRIDLTKYEKNCRKKALPGRLLLCYQTPDDRKLLLYIVYERWQREEVESIMRTMKHCNMNPYLYFIHGNDNPAELDVTLLLKPEGITL